MHDHSSSYSYTYICTVASYIYGTLISIATYKCTRTLYIATHIIVIPIAIYKAMHCNTAIQSAHTVTHSTITLLINYVATGISRSYVCTFGYHIRAKACIRG